MRRVPARTEFINPLVVALDYTTIMTARHSKTAFAAAALLLAGTALASAQGYSQSYPPPPGSIYASQPTYASQGNDRLDAMPDFDDDGDLNRRAPSANNVPQGPILSPDDPRYGRPGSYSASTAAVPQGPVMSPDDPRYGRPAGSPPLYANHPSQPAAAVQDGFRPPAAVGAQDGATAAINPGAPTNIAALPPEDQPESGPTELPPHLRRQEVDFATKEPPGTIVVDTDGTYLYYVLGGGRAIRYGVRVGREGFTWAGTQKITRKAEWPDWHPPAEMIERQPYLPRFMAGGPANPMGARAMYLGSTVYRIHGTNQPSTIGKFVSSGCIGMLNEDVSDLYDRVKPGARVVVWPSKKKPGSTPVASAAQPAPIGASASQGTVASAPGTSPAVVPTLPAPVTVR